MIVPLSLPSLGDILAAAESLAPLTDDQLSAVHAATHAALVDEPISERMQGLFRGLLAIRREMMRRHAVVTVAPSALCPRSAGLEQGVGNPDHGPE